MGDREKVKRSKNYQRQSHGSGERFSCESLDKKIFFGRMNGNLQGLAGKILSEMLAKCKILTKCGSRPRGRREGSAMMQTFGDVLSYLRELNMASMLLRLTLALLFGGLIGMERERKRRPAGFRTYMLVCLGAALTMVLSQYLALMLATRWLDTAQLLGLTTDASRFGAQVINGIGFLGAGTIIVTGRQEVKGLTTAAGLWTSACMGLAIGAGFYECVLPGFVLIFLCVRVFPRIENMTMARSRNMSIYVEVHSMEDMATVLQFLRGQNYTIFDVDLDRGSESSLGRPNAVIAMRLDHREAHTAILAAISKLDHVSAIEEL